MSVAAMWNQREGSRKMESTPSPATVEARMYPTRKVALTGKPTWHMSARRCW